MQRLRNKVRSLGRRKGVPRPATRQDWELLWERSDYNPPWNLQGVAPEALPALIDEGWITPDMTVLDIGCGDGQVAGWMAQQGFKSVWGTDVAPSAIARARETYGHLPNLHFEVQDVTEDTPSQSFDLLIDRGCFHIIPEAYFPQYAAYLRAASHPGSKLLMMHFTRPQLIGKARATVDIVRKALSPTFTVVDTQETTLITRDTGKPIVAIKMVRTDS